MHGTPKCFHSQSQGKVSQGFGFKIRSMRNSGEFETLISESKFILSWPKVKLTCQIDVSSALISLRMEQNLKLESIDLESQPTLACSYISTVILINAIKTLC